MARGQRRHREGLTVWLPIVISSAAFVLSASVAYFSFFRASDDLRLLIGGTPYFGIDAKSQTFEMRRTQDFTFINAGTRAVSINSIYVKIAQPKHDGDAFERNCEKGDVEYRFYDEKPFVVRPGEITPKSTMLYERFAIDINGHTRNATLDEVSASSIPMNKANTSLQRPRYQLCFEVAVATPDADLAELEAYEIAADIDRSGTDWMADIASDRRPIQLLKQTKNILWDR